MLSGLVSGAGLATSGYQVLSQLLSVKYTVYVVTLAVKTVRVDRYNKLGPVNLHGNWRKRQK
jgi:hypothetical protein